MTNFGKFYDDAHKILRNGIGELTKYMKENNITFLDTQDLDKDRLYCTIFYLSGAMEEEEIRAIKVDDSGLRFYTDVTCDNFIEEDNIYTKENMEADKDNWFPVFDDSGVLSNDTAFGILANIDQYL